MDGTNAGSTLRFAKISAERSTFKNLDRFETPNDMTFVVKLKKRVPVFIVEFPSFRVSMAIHPADVAMPNRGSLGTTVAQGDLVPLDCPREVERHAPYVAGQLVNRAPTPFPEA